MFGSVLRDVYGSGDRVALWDALDDLGSPSDTLVWSSVGLYAYFDPQPQRPEWPPPMLYVGMAGDISERVAAHNGLSGRAAPATSEHR